MVRELERWLPELAPPSGGEDRLRAALAARRRDETPAWRPALAAVCCVLLAAVALPSPAARPRAPDLAPLLDLPPPPAVRVEDGAALELPVAADGVRVVWVMDLGEDPPAR